MLAQYSKEEHNQHDNFNTTVSGEHQFEVRGRWCTRSEVLGDFEVAHIASIDCFETVKNHHSQLNWGEPSNGDNDVLPCRSAFSFRVPLD